MNIIQPTYEILTPISEGGIQELKFIEQIARKCYKSEDRITEDGESAKQMAKLLVENHHEAMIEHSQLSVLFTVDRGVSHEVVRHRLASFAQESTRYVNYAKEKFGSEIYFINPESGIGLDTKMKDLDAETVGMILNEWHQAMYDAENHYMKMIELGATPQIARSVLPHSTKTEIVVTANYREWKNIFNLRTPISAHPQMREMMIPLLKDVQNRIPIIFDDIIIKE